MAKKPKKITLGKRFRRFLTRLGFWSFYYFIGLIPASWAYALGRTGGRIAAALPFGHRHTIFSNLQLAYGQEKNERERKQLAGRVFANIGEILMDLILLCQESSPNLLDKVELKGKEHLEKALAAGKGVLAITGHIGFFILINPRLRAQGYDCRVINNPQYDPHMEKHIIKMKERLGIETIMTEPQDQCLQRTLECIHRGGILLLLMDQDARKRGIFVDFFGHPASTNPHPAALALRTGAAVVPMYIVYHGRGRHTLVIEPPLSLTDSGDFTADLHANTALFNKTLETVIRQYPDQWAWVNRRWKTKPNPTPDPSP
jgi:KDO2-lipid IV(A) lauroyltransferase